LQPVARADGRQTATTRGEIVAARDGRYVDNFGRGLYQGVTRDHWLEVELPADAPTNKRLY
jgi:hypothetical protein